jgi:histidinol-phosphate aminotransferase
MKRSKDMTTAALSVTAEALDEERPYRVPRPDVPIDLFLDGNEGAAPPDSLLAELGPRMPDVLRRYPDTASLEALLAEGLGVDAARVLVTAGGDDAIDRIARAYLAPGSELVFPTPSFEMIQRYARSAGAAIVEVPWPSGDWPLDAVLEAVTPATAMIAVVSPNNPTGAVATPDVLERLAVAAPDALLLVDLAYAEFADRDLTETALRLPNALVVRSLSKAWGLAGLRVGYAVGGAARIERLRAVGAPYAVSSPSLALAEAWLPRGAAATATFVDRVRAERRALETRLAGLGARPLPSEANFVLARFDDVDRVRDGLAGLGIAVRAFPDRPALQDALRITCPGNERDFQRLVDALDTVLQPQALLLDLDGVLADVSRSYRAAILRTAESFGVRLGPEEITAAKAEGNANNDWVLTRRLLDRRGVRRSLREVTERFEGLYQGTAEVPGLRNEETLIPDRRAFERLARRIPVAIVTGRPRSDAERFLQRTGIRSAIAALVCMEDAPAKPDPRPVRLAMERLSVRRAWMVGDTPDDVRAARAAGVVPLGITAPGDDPSSVPKTLSAAGAGRVLERFDELLELLP